MAVVSVEICPIEGANYGKEFMLSPPVLVDHLAGAANVNAAGNAFNTDQPLMDTQPYYARVTTDGACRVAFGSTPNVTATVPTEATTAAMLVLPNCPLIVRVRPGWKVATGAA